jgi:hypothetical protein
MIIVPLFCQRTMNGKIPKSEVYRVDSTRPWDNRIKNPSIWIHQSGLTLFLSDVRMPVQRVTFIGTRGITYGTANRM